MSETKNRELTPIQGAQPHFFGEIDEIVVDLRHALEKGHLAQGAKTIEFEETFAPVAGSRFCASISSGGSAIELVLKAIGIDGKEVIVPTNTFVATANSVTLAGGTPVFAETDPNTLCLDPKDALNRIGPKTAGIIFVPLFGLVPPAILELAEECKRRGLFLIEDAAHAHGATLFDKPAGSFGDAACFSFFATKVMTTGEGGCVTTNDARLHRAVLKLRNHGKDPETHEFETTSNNYRLNELSAIIGIHQLKHLPENLERRNWIADRYLEGWNGLEKLILLSKIKGARPSVWRFPALLAPGVDRTRFQNEMWDRYRVRVTWMYEPLCHLQPVFKGLGGRKGDLPVSEDIMERLVCFPTHGGMSDSDVDRVIEATRELL